MFCAFLGKIDDDFITVDLNKIIKDVIGDLEVYIQERDAEIVSDALPPVKGNELQISQLIFNLIGNALKFSDKKPEIKISGRLIHSEQVANPPLEMNTGGYLEIAFADNGIGFEQQYVNQIFALLPGRGN